jgi:hypothetical protein
VFLLIGSKEGAVNPSNHRILRILRALRPMTIFTSTTATATTSAISRAAVRIWHHGTSSLINQYKNRYTNQFFHTLLRGNRTAVIRPSIGVQVLIASSSLSSAANASMDSVTDASNHNDKIRNIGISAHIDRYVHDFRFFYKNLLQCGGCRVPACLVLAL